MRTRLSIARMIWASLVFPVASGAVDIGTVYISDTLENWDISLTANISSRNSKSASARATITEKDLRESCAAHYTGSHHAATKAEVSSCLSENSHHFNKFIGKEVIIAANCVERSYTGSDGRKWIYEGVKRHSANPDAEYPMWAFGPYWSGHDTSQTSFEINNFDVLCPIAKQGISAEIAKAPHVIDYPSTIKIARFFVVEGINVARIVLNVKTKVIVKCVIYDKVNIPVAAGTFHLTPPADEVLLALGKHFDVGLRATCEPQD